MKTWKKIEETRKRTTDITGLKKRNEEKVQKVSINRFNFASFREINCVLAVRLDQLFTVEFSINFYFNVQKIYDINLDNEMRKQMSQNNYLLSK